MSRILNQQPFRNWIYLASTIYGVLCWSIMNYIWKISISSELFSLLSDNLLNSNILRNWLNILGFLKTTVRQNLNITQDTALGHMSMCQSYDRIKILLTKSRIQFLPPSLGCLSISQNSSQKCQVVEIYLESSPIFVYLALSFWFFKFPLLISKFLLLC